MAAMAAGAFAAAGQTMASGEPAAASSDLGPFAQSGNASAAFGSATTQHAPTHDAPNGMGGSAPPPEVLPVAATAGTSASGPDSEVRKLAKSERIAEERAEAAAAKAEAERAKVVRPAEGRFTSGFGGRWGTTHYGIDFANSQGTPIVSAADGEVIEAGPASGFGQWVRVQHDDGTITVYGHVNTITAEEGDSVRAGDQIATMGSRGFSTGTHLHFEVWNPSGKKINPAPWLEQHGIPVH